MEPTPRKPDRHAGPVPNYGPADMRDIRRLHQRIDELEKELRQIRRELGLPCEYPESPTAKG